MEWDNGQEVIDDKGMYFTGNLVVGTDYASKDYIDAQINTGMSITSETMVSFGDFSISGDDLGRLLKKLAKKEMPEILI